MNTTASRCTPSIVGRLQSRHHSHSLRLRLRPALSTSARPQLSLLPSTSSSLFRLPQLHFSASAKAAKPTTPPKMFQYDDLFEKNQTWRTDFAATQPELAAHLAQTQTPKVLWIGCADSRIPESVVCGADPGDIFVTRNIANQFNPEDDNAMSVLTFAVQALGVEHVVVVGHTSCGGVNAAIAGASSPPSAEALRSSALLRHLVPLTNIAKNVVAKHPSLNHNQLAQQIIYQSVKTQVANVVGTDIIQDNWAGKPSPLSGTVMNKVHVHGLCYDVATAQLTDLKLTQSPN